MMFRGASSLSAHQVGRFSSSPQCSCGETYVRREDISPTTDLGESVTLFSSLWSNDADHHQGNVWHQDQVVWYWPKSYLLSPMRKRNQEELVQFPAKRYPALHRRKEYQGLIYFLRIFRKGILLFQIPRHGPLIGYATVLAFISPEH